MAAGDAAAELKRGSTWQIIGQQCYGQIADASAQ